MKIILYYVSLSFVLLNFACCKKKPTATPVEPFVFDLTNSCPAAVVEDQFTQYVYANNYKTYFQVNPSNPNEFLYYSTYGLTEHKLYIINRQSLQSTLLLDKKIFNPKWGKGGYIMFYDDSDFLLYTIKPNGDSLVKRVKAGSDFEWNFLGDKFLYCTRDILTDELIYIVQNIYTNQKDTIPFFPYYGTWQNEDNLYLEWSISAPKGFRITDMNNYNSYTIPFPFDLYTTSVMSVNWISKREFSYGLTDRVNIYNKETGKEIKFLKCCLNERPMNISYSAISNELFVPVLKYENIEGANAILLSTPKVLVFNLNNNTMSEIVFPQ